MKLMRAYVYCFALILPLYGQGDRIIPKPQPKCEGSWFPDGTYIPSGEEREVIIDGKRYRCVGCGECTPLDDRDERPSSPPSSSASGGYSPSGGGYSPEAIRRAKGSQGGGGVPGRYPEGSLFGYEDITSAKEERKREKEERKREREAKQAMGTQKEREALFVDYSVFYQKLKKVAPPMPTEYDALRRLEKEAQYLHVDLNILENLERKYANDPKILACIRSLKAKRKVMDTIARLASEYATQRENLRLTLWEAKREVERSLAEAASIGVPGADYVDELINGEITPKEFIQRMSLDGAVSYIQSIFKEERLTRPTTLSEVKATLSLLKKAVVVYEYYSVIDKSVKTFSYLEAALEKYVEAWEMRGYVRGTENGEAMLMEWFRRRDEALAESRRLYYLIEQRGR